MTGTESSTKPFRFVTNYGAPHPKRRRIAAACLTCRKRKTACSGEKPHCATCKQNRVDCAGYTTQAADTKRAPPKKQQKASDTAGLEENVDPELLPVRSPAPTASRFLNSASTQTHHSDNPASLLSSPTSHAFFPGSRDRMPYFRWLGPTAIMPGFKQMVVKIKQRDTDGAASSVDGGPYVTTPAIHSSHANSRDQGAPGLPFYDTGPAPPSELITHLAQTFFAHLGCNFPFLPRERFLRDLEAKEVDTILVDAVCALAARFSTHPVLKRQASSTSDADADISDYGQAYAQRAKVALIDTFAMPTIAAAQAALLIAYNEFGESRDSGLWMYLGIAIRFAEDLGLHKLEGLRFRGISGPTPNSVKHQTGDLAAGMGTGQDTHRSRAVHQQCNTHEQAEDVEAQIAGEQERIDTFWAIFFLDTVVSSGTGRRSTLRDKDIEVSFPAMLQETAHDDWPAPFPALIRVVHLYGTVADLLNCIKAPSDITEPVSKRLATMEAQVTNFYQGLSPRLHFDAINFQHYVKVGEGTNFVLLHFWFHTLIILLHQPTLLKTFEGKPLQLFPNSQQLSMSSAKTIADILSYSQLIDAKASLGNPFTTQPTYIAACAFLREAAEHSASSNAQSRAASPANASATNESPQRMVTSNKTAIDSMSTTKRSTTKHNLLATAASHHYQLCYKALQCLETYWAGTKYILTVLDQRFRGVGDPVLYTAEESESAVERPNTAPAFTTPGWRRNLRLAANAGLTDIEDKFWNGLHESQKSTMKSNPAAAIGWTMTGTMNSSSTNLAFHYPRTCDDRDAAMSANISTKPRANIAQQRQRGSASMIVEAGAEAVSDASLLLGLQTPFHHSPVRTQVQADNLMKGTTTLPWPDQLSYDSGMYAPYNGTDNLFTPNGMLIESQNVDMDTLGLDMTTWFDPIFGPANADLSLFDPQIPAHGYIENTRPSQGQ